MPGLRGGGGRSAGVAAQLAAPRLAAFAQSDGRDHERGRRIGPPPSEESVRAESDEQGDREVRAEHVLLRLARRRVGTELSTDVALGPREERHRQGCYKSETDADPSDLRVVASEEVADGRYGDVRREEEVGDGDQARRPRFIFGYGTAPA